MQFINEAFETNWIAPMGANVDSFEKEVCSYVGVKHGLALSSGTAGIHLALKYLGVGSGDYVFCSSLTFAGSCNPIIYQNAIPVFIDSEPESWNMSPLALEKAFEWAKKENKMPKAAIIVDLYGQSADYDILLSVCDYYGVPVIEDAAEALGATYQNRKCGSLGYIGIFSFNGNKIITTSGGGMVVSNDEEAIKKMRFWATQAREPALHYEHREVGYNYRMSNICAGIGRGQLSGLEERINIRKLIRERYFESFKNLPIELMPILSKNTPNYWLTVIQVKENSNLSPNGVILALDKANIESRPVWKPMNLQPVFQDYPFFSHVDKGNIGELLYSNGICLPSGSSMAEEEQNRVIEIVQNNFHKLNE